MHCLPSPYPSGPSLEHFWMEVPGHPSLRRRARRALVQPWRDNLAKLLSPSYLDSRVEKRGIHTIEVLRRAFYIVFVVSQTLSGVSPNLPRWWGSNPAKLAASSARLQYCSFIFNIHNVNGTQRLESESLISRYVYLGTYVFPGLPATRSNLAPIPVFCIPRRFLSERIPTHKSKERQPIEKLHSATPLVTAHPIMPESLCQSTKTDHHTTIPHPLISKTNTWKP
jgi:hypothetical protein